MQQTPPQLARGMLLMPALPPYSHDYRQRDTTDRSLAQRGNAAGFDPLGFAHELPYRRDLFYLSPYLSCVNCNTIIFVDASKLRSDLAGDIMPQERVIEVSTGKGGHLRVVGGTTARAALPPMTDA